LVSPQLCELKFKGQRSEKGFQTSSFLVSLSLSFSSSFYYLSRVKGIHICPCSCYVTL